MRSGRPPTLWWLLIVAAGPRNETDSITSGYSVPCARKRTSGRVAASSSNTSMKAWPMMRRFRSGSSTPASRRRKRSAASTGRSRRPRPEKTRTTSSASPARNSPLSTKMQVSRSPTARWTSIAATAESTPPLSPHTTRPPPTCARIRATSVSTNPRMVQSGAQPHTRNRKFRSTSRPRSVCATSGWNCTPKNRPAASRHAAIGELSERASTVQPAGRASIRSP